jgi:hypothetical protein
MSAVCHPRHRRPSSGTAYDTRNAIGRRHARIAPGCHTPMRRRSSQACTIRQRSGPGKTMTTRVVIVNQGCHCGLMKSDPPEHRATLNRLKEVRAQALEHTRIAREFSAERRQIMEDLLRDGFSQSDLARELGVTRQAIQKMLAV